MNRIHNLFLVLVFSLFGFQAAQAQCTIFDMTATVSDCDGGNFFVTINFQFGGVGGEGFKVQGNGVVYGTFEYADLPITIGPLPGNGTTNYEFIAKDILHPDCKDEVIVGPVSCPGGGACEIFDFSATPGDCGSDGKYPLTLDFEYVNPGNALFDVYYQGAVIGTYALANLPVTIPHFDDNGNAVQEIKVCINDQPNCCKVDVFESPCAAAACNIYDMTATLSDCDGGNFFVTINFLYNNVGGSGFKVVGNGLVYGTFAYADLPVTIGPLPGNGTTNYYFAVQDFFHPDCQDVVDLGPVSCPGGGNCEIFDFTATPGDCNSAGNYSLTLDFQYVNPGNDFFDVFYQGQNIGFYALADLPVTIQNFDDNGNAAQEIKVCINDQPNCCKVDAFEAPNCTGAGVCNIFDLTATASDCEAGMFFVTLDFEYENVGNNGFKVQGNGIVYGTFAYADLPITIGPLAGNGTTNYEFVVKDVAHPDCSESIQFGPVNCPSTGDCDINDLTATPGDCLSDGTYNLTINFNVVNPGNNFFIVKYQGETIVPHGLLANLPITIEHFDDNGVANPVILVCINDQPNCCSEVQFEAPDCVPSTCHIFDLTAETSECNAEGQFFVTIDFEYANVGGDGFKIYGNGNVYGFFQYADLPVTLGPFESTAGGQLEFGAADLSNPDCHDFAVIEAPDCDVVSNNCQIANLTADVHPCLSNGTFYVTLDFDHENTGQIFKVQGNGIVYGYFSYDDLPINIGPLVGNGTTNYEFVVKDLNHPDCKDDISIGTVSCGAGGDCVISDLIADPGACHSDGTYDLWLNFEFANAGSNFFDVYYNGDLVDNFPLSNLPAIIPHFSDNGEPLQTITVCIHENPNCCATVTYEAPDCPGLVWPGDGNADQVADHFDLLNIGLAFGAEGPQRPVQGFEWLGLVSEDWSGFFEDNVNFKHADANGNGKVNNGDLEVLNANFGLSHGVVIEPVFVGGTESDPPLYVAMPNTLSPGTPFNVPIILGTEGQVVQDIYGIAFTLNFDPLMINPASIDLQYNPSWIGEMGINLLTIDKTLAAEGKIKVALARTDQNNVSGYGKIAALIGIIDNIAGKDAVSIEVSDVRAIQKNGALINLRRPVETAVVTATKEATDQNALSVYPNPTGSLLAFSHAENLQVESVEIRTVDGLVVRTLQVLDNQINVEDLPSGVYLLKVKVGEGFYLKKMVKM